MTTTACSSMSSEFETEMLLVEAELPQAKRIRRPDKRYCPHCSQIVSYKSFKRHKHLYYHGSVWHVSSLAESGTCIDHEESPPASVENLYLMKGVINFKMSIHHLRHSYNAASSGSLSMALHS